MWQCKFCGYENADGTAVCDQCGTILDDEPTGEPMNDGEQEERDEENGRSQLLKELVQEKDGELVHSCGYPLIPGTKICPNCGKAVIMEVEQENEEIPENEESILETEEPEVYDPKKTRRVGADPAVDPKKTMVIGSTPVNDPKKTMVIGNTPANDPKKTMVIGSTPANDPKKTMVIGNTPANDPKKTMVIGNTPANDPKKTVVIGNTPENAPKETQEVAYDPVNDPKVNTEIGAAPVFNPKKTVVIGHTDANEAKMSEAELIKEAKKTVNPFAAASMEAEPVQEEDGVYCSIQPLADVGENGQFFKKFEFGSVEIVLRRNNTEPSNSSITSKEQALLTFEDGKWYIEDKSTFQTTFVRAGRKTQLQDGDIILLGDRRFVFNAEKKDSDAQ